MIELGEKVVLVEELVSLASDAAFALDSQLRILAWNQAAAELLGYTTQEVLGRPCHAVLRAVLPDGQPLCVPNCQAKLCFGRCQPYVVRGSLGRRKDGQWIRVGLSSMAMPKTLQSKGIIAVVFLRPLDENPTDHVSNAPLRIFTLGRFNMAAADRSIAFEKWKRKQALTLLKYLVTQRGRAVHREHLMECLWPCAPEPRGRERLKVTMHYLRQQLRDFGIEENVIETAAESYILRRTGIWVDADAFEQLVREGDISDSERKIDEALLCYREAEELYHGDYLEDDPYADWCAEERERLREIYLDMLARIAELYAIQGKYVEAAHVCRKALVREPCRESFHRRLMMYLWHLGRRDEALAQFHRCKRVLAQELQVEPMPDTQRLYQQILQYPIASK